MQRFRIDNASVGTRADVYLASKYPEFTRSSLELLFDNGLVTTAAQPIKAGQKLKENQEIKVDDSRLKIRLDPIDLPILYEDKGVVVINKAGGLLTHSKGALNLEPTIASFIRPKIKDASLTGNRAGIVHRLDRGTSGVIIAAKNNVSLKYLQRQFSQRKTKKAYIAVVEGFPEQPEAIIDMPIERNPKKPQTFRVGTNGRPAVTKYKVLKNFTKNEKNLSLIELHPQTGRTHQIRVHLKHIGHPVLGDSVYGTPAEHLYLHAKSLELTLSSGERKVFEAPLPSYFNDFTK